jgi:hypothetical protein
MNIKERFLYECEFCNQLSSVFTWFHEQKIEPLLIKGWLAAKNYPESVFRDFGDIDLIIPPSSYNELLSATKLKFPDVDLHKGARKHDTLTYEELFANSELKELINGDEIRVVSAEDHLRIMAVHWLNDGGTNKQKLWDIYFAVSNRPSTFNWDKCLNKISLIRRKWILTTIALAHRYFELKIDDLPFYEEIFDQKYIPDWIIQTLEEEWATDVHLTPLISSLSSSKVFLQQIRKRMPPNPVMSAIETETSFDDYWRFPSQIKAIFQRMFPQDGNSASLASIFYSKYFAKK